MAHHSDRELLEAINARTKVILAEQQTLKSDVAAMQIDVDAILEAVKPSPPAPGTVVDWAFSSVRIANGYELKGILHVTEFNFRDTDPPFLSQTVPLDMEGHPTGGNWPEGTTVDAQSSDPDIISATVDQVSVSFDPNGPSIGDATVAITVVVPDGPDYPGGKTFGPKNFAVHVTASPIAGDFDMTPQPEAG